MNWLGFWKTAQNGWKEVKEEDRNKFNVAVNKFQPKKVFFAKLQVKRETQTNGELREIQNVCEEAVLSLLSLFSGLNREISWI